MATHIEMPKLSDTMTEGTVVRWLKNLGDEVEIGDEIAEIETDKATMAMEAFDEGTLSEILIEEGGKAAVGATLAILRDEGEADAAPEEEPSTEVPVPEMASDPPAHLEPEAIEAKSPELVPEPTVEPATEPPLSPVARPTTSRRIKASPLARKMAQTNGVDLAGLTGSGPGGRIVRKDVVAAMGKADTIESTSKSGRVALATPVATPEPTLSLEAGDQRIELSSLRRITAERLLASKTTIPHFYLHTEADAAPLMEIRRQVNLQAEATHGNKYTVNDLILKAV
ncbi:MAG: biotin/lipoyl-containing protein, partial [Verrucomicrobiota bacterium]|nr:biotin/lipoyl-containing protein [Verrucomicrobiota bacterium]